MRSILFVDDDPNILNGLRDLLRKQRKSWDMVFALGGPAALEELDKRAFDVVVSDMRMPTVDGAALLSHVKNRYPGSARIVLSGHAERDAVVRALPVAHQFLSKPCDVNVLRSVVERACELQRMLHDESIRNIVGKLDKLPSAPDAYWELTRAAARPDVRLEDLVAIVGQDPALAVKVLQLVNSAYFGSAKKVASIEQAVAMLGTDLLKALALSVHAFETLKVPAIDGFSLEQTQRHSLLAARIAKRIAPRERAAEAFTAALVHDIGKLVLAVGAPDGFGEALRQVRTTGEDLCNAERTRLGVTHADVGAYLLGVWGLPLPIVEAVAYHHTPNTMPEGPFDTVAVVHAATQLANFCVLRKDLAAAETALDLAFLERAAMRAQVPKWVEIAAEICAAAEAAT